MGRAPCCDKANVKKGPWSPEEDATLKAYIEQHGTGGNWIALPQKIGLKRCGKSCRLRWLNYLRPNIKHGGFTEEEENIICNLYINIGSRWSIIAAQLPGRTDNDIKNYWNTRLKKKLIAKQRKDRAAAGIILEQEIKREISDSYVVNQTLNQVPAYWADPQQQQQLSMPMMNNMIHSNQNQNQNTPLQSQDDLITRLIINNNNSMNNYQIYEDSSSNNAYYTQSWPNYTEYDHVNNNNNTQQQEGQGGNFPVDIEAYFSSLLWFDGIENYSSSDRVGNSTSTTTTSAGSSSSWGDMSSLVNNNTQISSNFDAAYQQGMLQKVAQ